jgi:hypothetical protein
MGIYEAEESFWRQWILKGMQILRTSIPLPMVVVENAPSHAYGIMTVYWRIIGIFPPTPIPSIRSSSR